MSTFQQAQDLGWLGFVYARVYLTDLATMNSTEMTASLYSTPLEDYQARWYG